MFLLVPEVSEMINKIELFQKKVKDNNLESARISLLKVLENVNEAKTKVATK